MNVQSEMADADLAEPRAFRELFESYASGDKALIEDKRWKWIEAVKRRLAAHS